MIHKDNPVIEQIRKANRVSGPDIKYDVFVASERVGIVYAESDTSALEKAIREYGFDADMERHHNID